MNTSTKLSTSQKGFATLLIILGIALLLILIAVGGLYYYIQQVPKYGMSYVPSPPEVIRQRQTSTPSSTVDETTNWKTYTSSSFGITFKYPPDGNVTEKARILYLMDNSNGPDHYIFTFEIKSNLQLLTAQQFIDDEITTLRNDGNPGSIFLANKRQETIKNYQNGEINGLYMRGGSDGDSVTDFIKIVAVPKSNQSSIYIFVIHDGNGSVGGFQKKLMEQLLSTFKFLHIQIINP